MVVTVETIKTTRCMAIVSASITENNAITRMENTDLPKNATFDTAYFYLMNGKKLIPSEIC